jgi:hypothetical protein
MGRKLPRESPFLFFGGRNMSFSRSIILLSLLAAGCTTTQSMHDSSFADESTAPTMRHSLRELVHYDSYTMTRLVDKELNMRETDEDAFLRDATMVLTQTVIVQPHFPERQAALRELKAKLDQEDYIYILQKASDNLVYLIKNSPAPSDQATALVGLKNLVLEAKTLNREELKPSLQKIADAHIQVSQAAQQYADEPMMQLVSPSSEAELALAMH